MGVHVHFSLDRRMNDHSLQLLHWPLILVITELKDVRWVIPFFSGTNLGHSHSFNHIEEYLIILGMAPCTAQVKIIIIGRDKIILNMDCYKTPSKS